MKKSLYYPHIKKLCEKFNNKNKKNHKINKNSQVLEKSIFKKVNHTKKL